MYKSKGRLLPNELTEKRKYAHKMKIKDLKIVLKYLISKFRSMVDELIPIKRNNQKQKTRKDVFDN